MAESWFSKITRKSEDTLAKKDFITIIIHTVLDVYSIKGSYVQTNVGKKYIELHIANN